MSINSTAKTAYKKNYCFVIDEAGSLETTIASKIFLMGCVITSKPEERRTEIDSFMKQLKNNIYFQRHIEQIKKEGLHACSNHPDIYVEVIKFLSVLDFRYYCIVINKTTPYFKNLIDNKTNQEIYDDCIKILISDRLVKKKDDYNTIIFEQNLSTPSAPKKENEGRK